MQHISRKQCFLLALTLLMASFSHAADTLTTATFNVPQTYSNPGGAYIRPGSIVTVNSAGSLTFNYDLTIDTGAVLIVNGGTIKVGDGKRIILQQSVASFTWTSPAQLQLNTNGLITSLTSLPTGNLWQGIECKESIDNSNIPAVAPILKINGGTIQYATCGFRGCDATGGGIGRIYAQNATFLNNYRSLYITAGWGTPIQTLPPNQPGPDSISWSADYVENSTFRLTSDFASTPPDMVYLYFGPLVFQSCTFKAESYIGAVTNGNNYNFVNNTAAITSVNPRLWIDQQVGAASGCSFAGFENGITTTNDPTYWSPVVVANSSFACVSDLSLMGSRFVYILGNTMYGPVATSTVSPPPINFCSVFLRNTPNYMVEGNEIGYDISEDPQGFNYGGIVVMDCGDSNNTVYRNDVQVPYVGVGIESIGTNRNAAATSGMKILCNKIHSTNYDIAIMRDSTSNPVNGIADHQLIPGAPTDTSAANLFLGASVTNPYKNYYLDGSANNPLTFLYKYDPAFPNEEPVYHNFPNMVTTNVANTCPSRKVRSPQPSMTFNAPANVHVVFYGDGEGNGLAERPASGQGEPPATVLQPVQQWLTANKGNWASLPKSQKELVYQTANDPMFDGAAARSLLAQYEGKKYDPVVLIPKTTMADKINQGSNDKIYPNPAKDKAIVNWDGANATLTLTNATGQILLSKEIKSGMTLIDLTGLNDGIYFAQIYVAGKSAYQQKLVIAK